jgi:hypothetical protein
MKPTKPVAAAKTMLKDFGDEYISTRTPAAGHCQRQRQNRTPAARTRRYPRYHNAAVKELRKGRKVTDQSSDTYTTPSEIRHQPHRNGGIGQT